MTYYYSSRQSRHYKLSQQDDRVLIYWVSVYRTDGGGFFHGRGADAVADLPTGKKLLEMMAEPSTEQDYINALKDYFAIDKKVREQFIKAYNL
jgi:hypothetical protein